MLKHLNRTLFFIRYCFASFSNYFTSVRLYVVTEDADWVSSKHSRAILSFLTKSISFKLTISHLGIRNSVIHFENVHKFFGSCTNFPAHKSNKIIVTCFHIVDGDERFKLYSEKIQMVNIWHTSCQITKNKLMDMNISEDIIVVIPLGVDLNIFNKPSLAKKKILKKQFQIPNNRIVIGYFQKDGIGWGSGIKPKYIKGPDIFCDVIDQLNKKYNIFVLLTGPARGYVKSRLKKSNIPYSHKFLKDPDKISDYYKAIDLYLVTSREEGGPKAVLESMASGVPLISSKVGMAVDLISDGKNGFLVDIGDSDSFYKNCLKIIENKNLSKRITDNALEIINYYDYSNISHEYLEKLYNENSYNI